MTEDGPIADVCEPPPGPLLRRCKPKAAAAPSLVRVAVRIRPSFASEGASAVSTVIKAPRTAASKHGKRRGRCEQAAASAASTVSTKKVSHWKTRATQTTATATTAIWL